MTDIRDMSNAAVVVINPKSDGHVRLIRAIVDVMPYGNQCERFHQNGDGSVTFKWRDQLFNVSSSGYCMKVEGGCLIGDDISILAGALIKRQLMSQ